MTLRLLGLNHYYKNNMWFLNGLKSIFASVLPHLIGAALNYLKYVYSEKLRKKTREEKQKELIEKEKQAKSEEDQKNAFKDIVDHANGD